MTLLALAPAHDLSYPRNEKVHGRHGASVIVKAHVKGLDGGRIIDDENRPPNYALGEIALVHRLEVVPPRHRKLEGLL